MFLKRKNEEPAAEEAVPAYEPEAEEEQDKDKE